MKTSMFTNKLNTLSTYVNTQNTHHTTSKTYLISRRNQKDISILGNGYQEKRNRKNLTERIKHNEREMRRKEVLIR